MLRISWRDKVKNTEVLRNIGVDLAGLLGGRMASADGGSVSSGVAYGEGYPLSSRLICISVPPAPNSGGGLVPPVPPVIYAHA